MRLTNNNPFDIYDIKIYIFEEKYNIGFDELLQCVNSGRLKAKIGFVFVIDLANEFLKRKFTDK
jgi:hypothetical protein